MREILEIVDDWTAAGKKVVVGTVVRIWGSAPRDLGAKMAVSSDGGLAGSVSGGCIEGAVAAESEGVLATGEPKLLRYGVTRDRAWEVGLTCGGTIEVFLDVHRDDDLHRELREAVRRRLPVATVTVLDGPARGRRLLVAAGQDPVGRLGGSELDGAALFEARERLNDARGARVEIEAGGGRHDAFVDVWPPAPRLVIVGASHVAIPLVRIARTLEFRTFVVDPRSAFATRERFPGADEIVVDWPEAALARIGLDAGTYVTVLSHDDKIDLPALKAALAAPVRYVGVLGSRRTHAKRERALLEAGVPAADLARIHAPIGLDLGGRRPEEIALSAMAEMVRATYPSGSGGAKVRM